ncbi:L10-interacting MYB domain-containing protein-like [Argentina anserina]|uniref:L10-interacting MYB domain-containing protein-like n=1 Tax=Argentina anserina TaxID=57926 RepID=UPI00217673F5|nr:L10-interacting MYB domain-containing protein-like [Potentilla anserina]
MGECVSDQDQSRAKWTTFSTKIFVDLLVEQIRKGNRGSGAFSKLAWKIIRDEFNQQTGLNFDKQQLKNHLDVLRKRYNMVKAILDHTGFSWDVAHMVRAEDDVWQEYIEAHPEADIIRKRGCDIYEHLCIIFSSDSGINEKHVIAVSGTASHQMNEEQSRAKWSMPLEKVLADLMLEQVAQGNRSNNAFNNQAWKHIHNEFNRQTGLNYDKQQLKNHHSVLRRSYHSVKSLLDQDGFSWDKSRCMVAAESDVWANYIEKHPEIEAVRVKGCPLYEQLESIFSESGSAGVPQPQTVGNSVVPEVPQPQTASFQMDTLPSEDQSKQDQSRAKWTVALDKILLNLLMEQSQQNKMYNKKAWKHIQHEFNYRTGLTFDGEQLRNHQNVLRRVYNNIKTVLDEPSFSWDDSRHVVVADDAVWEQYIMAHPEAETVRNKECPIFKELCTLFSDPRSEGRYVQSNNDVKLDQLKVEMNGTPETASVSADPAIDEASSRLSEEVNMSSGRNKRQSLIKPLVSSTRQRRRVCKETSQTGVNEISRHEEGNKTAAAAAAVAAQNGDRFSISSCIEVLNEMGGVDQDVYLAALDLFQDPDRRETFICIKSDLKLAWLRAKCNSLV